MLKYWEILTAIQSDIPIYDSYAKLWGKKLSNDYTTYTGTLPAVLTGTKAGYLHRYKIYGNMEQAGTPTPESPIVPSGCGERTENLFDLSSYYEVSSLISDIIIEKNRITYNAPRQYLAIKYKFNLGIADVYTIGLGADSLNTRLEIRYGKNGEYVGRAIVISPNQKTTVRGGNEYDKFYVYISNFANTGICIASNIMLNLSSTALPYEPYGYKLPLTSGNTPVDIYIGDDTLSTEEYVDSGTGKIYRRTKNLSPPEEEWIDGQIGGGDGTVSPSTQIKVSPFIDVSTCETCIMEVFSAETEWAAAGYREMAFYDENKQYLGWIGGGGRQTLTPDSTEMLSEFPAGTVYVRIGCSHGDQPFHPQLVSGYTPTHQFYAYLVPTDPPAPFPQIPTTAGSTTISWAGEGLAPSEVEFIY